MLKLSLAWLFRPSNFVYYMCGNFCKYIIKSIILMFHITFVLVNVNSSCDDNSAFAYPRLNQRYLSTDLIVPTNPNP